MYLEVLITAITSKYTPSMILIISIIYIKHITKVCKNIKYAFIFFTYILHNKTIRDSLKSSKIISIISFGKKTFSQILFSSC